MKTLNYSDWLAEFNRLASKYINGIDWEKVIWEDGEIAQAGDDIQLDAYRNCYFEVNDGCEDDTEYSHNPSMDDWCFYYISCEDRTDFIYALQDKWNEQIELRKVDDEEK